ncbi:MAG: Protein ApaG [Alphaproteobacteria bacterium MarineAlpha5_Bin11]|nr:Co2+/Mg2+ efflux protein ApaG [Pelagibacteraceae bacterium]PPR44475.1 MAG: Protein ApaG [Alphaproteobacteria bacterium MarineAlpha5_Bin11]PPR51165.1 MAG: Protein ApaG [Alphaproteobacteria bacterium MarineAlpha5_Bin10]|tara:strand:+ start:13094 stop:13489 length:396 start_codon:yes stop_codon:yes gene_type:complete
MYSKTTKKINIKVEPFYLEEQSVPSESHYVWAYKIVIDNKSKDTVKLKNRYWKIIDSTGNYHEVRGSGVVGEQPILKPGDKFEYTSGAPLNTPSGFMVGHYEMENNIDGRKFDVDIPLFSLDSPHSNNQVH